MICPYCLSDCSSLVSKCINSDCKQPIPPLYAKYHGSKGCKAPIMVSVIGFSGHGKTVFLGSLFSFIDHQLPQVWKGFSRQAINEQGSDSLNGIVKQLLSGYLPAPTPRTFPQPSIHRFWKIPKFGDQTLIFYDPPGEAFNTSNNVERYARFVKQSQVVLFLVSLCDLRNVVANEIHHLLETYQLGLSSLGTVSTSQDLIVVFTKADLLSSEFQLPTSLQAALANKDYKPLTTLDSYLDSLKRLSRLLKDFTENILKAHNFINLAERHFRTVEYTIISSTGSNPDNGRLTMGLLSSRVLDPLLWILIKEKSRSIPLKRVSRVISGLLITMLLLFLGYWYIPLPTFSNNSRNTRIIKSSNNSVIFRKHLSEHDSFNDRLTELPSGTKVETLNMAQFHLDGEIWEKIRHNNIEGWVNEKYLNQKSIHLNTPAFTFKKRFVGVINGKYGIEMTLERTNNLIKGIGIYNKYQLPFPVEGTINSDGTFIISEYADHNEISGYYQGKMSSLTIGSSHHCKIEGSWIKVNNTNSFPFILIEK